jgi:Tfp pilus assembly protein PilZ
VGAVRLELRLSNQSEWIKIFDPRDWTVFVPTEHDVIDGTQLRIDLDVGGWLVTLRGTVVGSRQDTSGPNGGSNGGPNGVVVALGGSERDKINYLNGYVRGGLLNLREKRRLPIRLQVTYGAVEGPANTFTKDINEEGVFLFTDKPLPETSQIHMLVTIPGQAQPLSLMGKVSHTIIAQDEEPPGMGIVFELEDGQRELLIALMKELEEQFHAGQLPTNTVE